MAQSVVAVARCSACGAEVCTTGAILGGKPSCIHRFAPVSLMPAPAAASNSQLLVEGETAGAEGEGETEGRVSFDKPLPSHQRQESSLLYLNDELETLLQQLQSQISHFESKLQRLEHSQKKISEMKEEISFNSHLLFSTLIATINSKNKEFSAAIDRIAIITNTETQRLQSDISKHIKSLQTAEMECQKMCTVPSLKHIRSIDTVQCANSLQSAIAQMKPTNGDSQLTIKPFANIDRFIKDLDSRVQSSLLQWFDLSQLNKPSSPSPVASQQPNNSYPPPPPQMSKYVRMLELGVPLSGIENRMRLDHVRPQLAHEFLSRHQMQPGASGIGIGSAVGGPPPPPPPPRPSRRRKSGRPVSMDMDRMNELAKYIKMVRVGVPRSAINSKMMRDNLDPSALDPYLGLKKY